MTASNFYNPIIKQRIQRLISQDSWALLRKYFDQLSNTNFRKASIILSDCILVNMDSKDFWKAFIEIVSFKPKAFLVTFLKAAVVIKKNKVLNYSDLNLLLFANNCCKNNAKIDIHKCISYLLPAAKEVNEAESIFKIFCITKDEERLRYLIACKTNISYYLIFQIFKYHDHQEEFIKKYILIILQNNRDKDFNFIEIMKVYFNIKNIKSTFSLHISPYQLSYIDNSYETFLKVLKSI